MSRCAHSSFVACTMALLLTTALSVSAADWSNAGGNAGRNGLTSEIGPDADDLLWSGGRTSLIAWQPVTMGRKVFIVRQSGWPSAEPGASPVVAMDLDSGDELWAIDVPFFPGDWTTWIAGARDGRVYVSRAGNGASVSSKLYALDAETGAEIWESVDEIDAGAYDGVVFAPNGDLIIGSFRDIWRISAVDGTTVWRADRTCSTSGNCGCAATEDAVYVVDAVFGGNEIIRYDIATGAELYASPVLPGFTIQNSPMVGPDGTIYLSRVQNNETVDFFYSMRDTGSEIVENWNVAAQWTTSSEFGVGPDGSVYMLLPGYELVRLDPSNGSVIDTAGVLDGFSKPRMAIDALGRLFVGNGAFSTGRLYSFDADLTFRWSVGITNINIGGPAIGEDGTLIVCGNGTNVRAYRTPRFVPADFDEDNDVDLADFDFFDLCVTGPCETGVCEPALYGDPNCAAADFDEDGDVDMKNAATFFEAFTGS